MGKSRAESFEADNRLAVMRADGGRGMNSMIEHRSAEVSKGCNQCAIGKRMVIDHYGGMLMNENLDGIRNWD